MADVARKTNNMLDADLVCWERTITKTTGQYYCIWTDTLLLDWTNISHCDYVAEISH